MRLPLRSLALLLAACCVAGGYGQTAPSHPTSTPYSGDLSIFEYPDRDAKLQPQRILSLLGAHLGSSVADIGAGGGWMTVRAARVVGAGGSVYAEEINPAAVDAIRVRAARENLPQVHAILGTPDDPKLHAGSVDVIIMLKMYHEIANAQALLHNLVPAMRPGAVLGIIDRNGDGADHGLNEAVVVRELDQSGFTRVGRYTFTKADGENYFLIFKRK